MCNTKHMRCKFCSGSWCFAINRHRHGSTNLVDAENGLVTRYISRTQESVSKRCDLNRGPLTEIAIFCWLFLVGIVIFISCALFARLWRSYLLQTLQTTFRRHRMLLLLSLSSVKNFKKSCETSWYASRRPTANVHRQNHSKNKWNVGIPKQTISFFDYTMAPFTFTS